MKLFIYFHRDFDGMVSAALLTDIFKKLGKYKQFSYIPVDFHLQDEWLNRRLEQPSAVLDFFYHPDAKYCYDHHVSAISEQYFGQVDSDNICLNMNFKSTPAILKYKFEHVFDFSSYYDVLKWSDIIDNSEYESPKDLYDSNNKYILLNKLISYYQHNNEDESMTTMIPYLLDHTEQYLALHNDLIEGISQEERAVIQQLRGAMRLEHPVCIVDQSGTSFPVQRFIGYYYYPDLDYQLILYRKNEKYMVNMGRNPWKEFQSRNMGQLASKYGGFGRKDVGGIIANTYEEAHSLVNVLMRELTT